MRGAWGETQLVLYQIPLILTRASNLRSTWKFKMVGNILTVVGILERKTQ